MSGLLDKATKSEKNSEDSNSGDGLLANNSDAILTDSGFEFDNGLNLTNLKFVGQFSMVIASRIWSSILRNSL
jgi:hypothetical protein